MNEKSSCGQSCLHLAIKVRDSKMIKILLERGAVIDEKDKNEKTALHLAAENYNSEAVSLNNFFINTILYFVKPNNRFLKTVQE